MSKKIFSVFNHDRLKGIEFTEPSMTQQQFKEESDINNIVDYNMRYKDPAFMTKLQLAGRISQAKPIYGDFTSVEDFQKSLNIIKLANEQFNALPAKVRERFGNDPSQMLAFVDDKANYNEAVSLGLIKAKEEAPVSLEENNKTNVENAGSEPISGIVPETSAQPLT